MRIYVLLLLIRLTSASVLGQTLKDEWVICNPQGCKLLDPYYSAGVTMKWEGECLSGKANGIGKLTKYMNGEFESTYEGEFKNGVREGKGIFTHKDGSIAKGTFINGQLMGYGTRTGEDGSKYEGDFINYRCHGRGIYHLANGAQFEGFFVSDRMYTGKYTKHDGSVSYLQEYVPVSKIIEKSSGYKPEIGVRVTEYFDSKWNRCQQKDASFYRLVTYEAPNKPKGLIKDYYITGQLQSEFTAIYLDYDDEGKNFHEGEATWYHTNGKIEQKRYYFNNKLNGKNSYYFDNGQQSQEANYNFGKLNGEFRQWYRTGKLKLSALYENGNLVDNKFFEFDENGVGALVYNENFRLNKEKWESKLEGSESSITSDNQLSLNLTKNETASRLNYVTLEQYSNFSIESSIQKRKGKDADGYGIVFGFKDWSNYFSFLISEQGYYIIYEVFEGLQIKIADWKQSSAINIGNKRNLLKIFKFDDEFVFSINGQVLEKCKSKNLRGNFFGIQAKGIGDYILENIIVKEFLSSEELQKRAPRASSTKEEWRGNGSGFFIHESGYLVTNYHVIEDAQDIQIEYYQKGVKSVYSVKVIVSDKQNDLTILKVDDPNFKTLSKIPYVFTSNIKDVGTSVFALGYPIANVMGEEIKFTDGKISSKTGVQGDVTVYQISVPIQPGNSGGPLFDYNGNLIGITSAGLNKEYFNSENVNYAIKTSYLKNLIDVMPESITLPNSIDIYNKSLTDKIKLISDFVPIIKIR